MENKRYTKWKCKECEGEIITDSKSRHSMVSCEKGCSHVDAEEHYVRVLGDGVEFISNSNEKYKK